MNNTSKRKQQKQQKQQKRKSKRWQKQKRSEDTVMEDARDNDLVIPLMGPTGVGKSTFINKYFGQMKAEVGDTLTSCTRNLAWYTLDLPEPFTDQRLVLVDTPGFDDTNEDDSEILRRIAVWLAASYENDMSLAGVLYLNDISQKRMLGSTRMNLKMFESLVGLRHKGTFPTIGLVTTQWDTVQEDVGIRREGELKKEFWKDAIDKGANVYRVHKDVTQASIVDDILNKSREMEVKNTAMLIQHELVDKERPIPLTEAGQKLRYNLDELLKHQAEIAKSAQDDANREEANRRYSALMKQAVQVSTSMKDRITHWLRL
ncbi:P-loop containing nucleoside triphosphate hydrolase protein [Coprinopsis sp. MPI-PUGE-AT-0042]|nr:P-loop containing nucleoside triphosphate hydrolase protein [Coprinopsis sp. MPI-PUGE-AT-0042]